MPRGAGLFDVKFHGNKILRDVIADFLIRIDLGIQPSACPSSGRRAEIYQHEFAICLRLRDGFVYIFLPCESHVSSLSAIMILRVLKACATL